MHNPGELWETIRRQTSRRGHLPLREFAQSLSEIRLGEGGQSHFALPTSGSGRWCPAQNRDSPRRFSAKLSAAVGNGGDLRVLQLDEVAVFHLDGLRVRVALEGHLDVLGKGIIGQRLEPVLRPKRR